MRSIDADTGSLYDYSLSVSCHKLVKRYRLTKTLLVVAFLIVLAVASFWGIRVLALGGLSFAGFACVYLAIIVMSLGARAALLDSFRHQAERLDTQGTHDWNLYWYQHHLRNSAKNRDKVLLSLAQLDIERGAYSRAHEALAEIDASTFTGKELKLFYLVALAAAAYGKHDYNEASDWYERYCSVPVKHADLPGVAQKNAEQAERQASAFAVPAEPVQPSPWQFPHNEVVQGWASRSAPEQEVQQAVRGVVPAGTRHAAVPLILSIMLAHCIFFTGVWLGVGENWHLRLMYLRVAGLLDAAFVTVLVIWLLVYARRYRHATSRGWHKALTTIACTAVVLATITCASCIALGVLFDSNGTEQTIATSVPSSDERAPYDYLAVYWNATHGTDGTTGYYRTRDFILMESWPPAASYNGGQATQQGGSTNDDGSSQGNGASQKSGSAASGATDATPDSISGTGGTGSAPSNAAADSQGYSGAVQNEMQAVYLYLQGQNAFENMALSFAADAKGGTYAVVGTGQEDQNDTSVTYEYRLYDNGEQVSNEGVYEEIALEKCYPSGESDTELVDRYLVSIVDLTVTDEHKASW